MTTPPSGAESALLRSARLTPLPALGAGEFTSWVETRGQLRGLARRPGKAKSFLYLAPREGFTAGQFILARDLGGIPVEAAHTIRLRSEDPAGVHPGDVVVVELPTNAASAKKLLIRAVVDLRKAGFRPSALPIVAAATLSG